MADHGFSERRACRLIGVNRSAWQYEPLRGQGDAVRVRMREIANERRRFGYQRLAIPLRREGKGMNLKKVYRLYREERLTVRKRGGRKRALWTRAPMGIPQELNQRWSLDFEFWGAGHCSSRRLMTSIGTGLSATVRGWPPRTPVTTIVSSAPPLVSGAVKVAAGAGDASCAKAGRAKVANATPASRREVDVMMMSVSWARVSVAPKRERAR